MGRWTPIRTCLPAALLLAFDASCRSPAPTGILLANDYHPAIRFLLTFDDGPSNWQPVNPTLQILDQLATNDIQPGIKAIFFAQTHHPRAGASPVGRAIMCRMHADGHLIGPHSVSPTGHVDHTTMPANALVTALQEAKDMLRAITGADPLFVRPPFGAHNPATRRIYAQLGLHMLMADIRARDGIIYGYNGSLRRRSHLRKCLAQTLDQARRNPVEEDPVVVTFDFHDVNPYTARHMTEYLHILVEEARRVGFTVPAQPFFSDRDELIRAAIARRVPEPPGCPPTATLPRDAGRASTTAATPGLQRAPP
jgi:peptidoglycan/xylan/chitin deacetylase (PgdA/CDA1 family)